MKEQSNGIKINAAVVSDRGLSKKRPLNEDSFLSDPERRIFAVADGVGGAQAGEVASQTAMEVLDEAFRHIEPGADVEDLLEIAIQRANTSIHSMSREHPKLSMMATTIVALHLDGHIATIGHVGDSRLYRLTPDGQLHRETADHSVVEEEVRAGRMTPEQASNHPSRNVISRALGAEESVEVDLKTMEIDDGTAFLLCSDGITRHIPDTEIRELLTSGIDLSAICEEMKRRCYERGAEDNLTAVIIRVGDPVKFTDEERTLVSPRPELAATMSGETVVPSRAELDAVLDSDMHDTAEPLPKGSATAGATTKPLVPPAAAASPVSEIVVPQATAPAPRRSAFKSLLKAIAFLLFLGVASAAAFWGGMFYQKNYRSDAAQQETASTTATTTAPLTPQAQQSAFQQERDKVDKTPQKWLNDVGDKAPAGLEEAEFRYLKGRALSLTRNFPGAMKEFNNALVNLPQQSPTDVSPLKVDILIGKVMAAAKTGENGEMRDAFKQLEDAYTPQAPVGPNTTGTAQPKIPSTQKSLPLPGKPN